MDGRWDTWTDDTGGAKARISPGLNCVPLDTTGASVGTPLRSKRSNAHLVAREEDTLPREQVRAGEEILRRRDDDLAVSRRDEVLEDAEEERRLGARFVGLRWGKACICG